MNEYLGETPVDVSTHPKFSKYTPTDWAMYFVESGQGDGSHHKQWALDQVARCLKGMSVVVVEAKWDNGHSEYRISTEEVESKEYKKWVKEMRGKKIDGEYEYDYDAGIAP